MHVLQLLNLFLLAVRRKKKNFSDDLSNSGLPFDYMVKAGQPARPKTKE
jgi:hypothetical protein